jgi:hypothetical protein
MQLFGASPEGHQRHYFGSAAVASWADLPWRATTGLSDVLLFIRGGHIEKPEPA